MWRGLLLITDLIREACGNAASSARIQHLDLGASSVQVNVLPEKFIDEFRWAGETSPMPEQELPINAGISLDSAANPDVHSIGETKQGKFMSEADARAHGYRPAKNGQ
jgi:hypothetical protein